MITAFKLMGVHEVAEYLGISPQQVSNMVAEGNLPTPLDRLASGPVWERAAIVEFGATWDRRPGRARAPKWRYVEVAVTLPGDDVLFRCGLFEAKTPRDALRQAVEDARAAHPSAVKVEEFIQRTLRTTTADEVRALILDKSWPGWFEFEDRRRIETD